MDKKFFTIDEVNQLLPQIEYHVRKMMECKKAMNLTSKRLKRLGEEPQLLESSPDPRPEVEEVQQLLRSHYQQFKTHTLAIETLGGRIKDFELGRVEFLSRDGERIVSLIWQLGVTSRVHSEEVPIFLVNSGVIEPASVATEANELPPSVQDGTCGK